MNKTTWTAPLENSGRRRTDWSFLPRPKTPGSTTSSSESYVSSCIFLFLEYDPSKKIEAMFSFLHIGNLKSSWAFAKFIISIFFGSILVLFFHNWKLYFLLILISLISLCWFNFNFVSGHFAGFFDISFGKFIFIFLH